MTGDEPLHLFSAVGIELEYMIVDGATLDVRPIADVLLRELGGGDEPEMEVELGDVAWSNELALHVLELKTNGPSASLAGVAERFQAHVSDVNRHLGAHAARLLPTGMHPWMDPERELTLWPHGNDVIYQAFDRIFDCRGHGWSNLQSMHINLPFSGDDEFGRLHAAIRLVLPLLPALAASSPIMERKVTGLMDTRLDVYRTNAARVPSVSGVVIPERVFSRHEYEDVLLGGVYADLAPLDPEGVLRHEWVNARGAIARFDRMAIEIRVLDVQECPAMDLAIAEVVIAAVRGMVEETWCSYEEQRGWDERQLAETLSATVRDADHAVIDDVRYLAAWGLSGRLQAGELWARLVERVLPTPIAPRAHLGALLDHGCLARRILRCTGPEPDLGALRDTYLRLADCLGRGEPLVP